jgi:hypothetical protein
MIPTEGLGRLAPHIMPMLGQFVCFKLDMRGRIICAGSGDLAGGGLLRDEPTSNDFDLLLVVFARAQDHQ